MTFLLTKLNAYTLRVKQAPLDTDPLMWWNQHVQEFPRLVRMNRQYLAVPVTSASPERLFSSVGLVKSELWGRLLDTTLIDVTGCGLNKHPELNLKEINRNDTHTLTETYTHLPLRH